MTLVAQASAQLSRNTSDQILAAAAEAPRATQLKLFDFDERSQGNYEDTPMRWSQLSGRGLPGHCRGRFDEEVGRTAPPSFRLDIHGVGANVAYEYAHHDLIIEPQADYLISGFVRCRGLSHARAMLAAYVVDRFGERVPDSERVSELVADTDTPDEWQRVEVPMSADARGAFAIRIQLWVLQSAGWKRSDRQSPDAIRREDVQATAWFDDLRVIRVPRARLIPPDPSAMVAAHTAARLRFEVNGVGERSFEARFTILDPDGRERARHGVVIAGNDQKPVSVPFPAQPPGRYRAVAEVFVGEERVLRREILIAVIPELPRRNSLGAAISADLGMWQSGDLGGLSQLLTELSLREVKVHLPLIENIDALESVRQIRAWGRLLRTLAELRIDTVGVLRPPLRTDAPLSLHEYVRREPGWRDALSPLLAQIGGQVHRWQLGVEADEVLAIAWEPGRIASVRDQLRRYVAVPDLLVPASALDPPVEGLGAIRSVLVPDGLPSTALARHLDFLLAPASQRDWLRIRPPAERNLRRLDRIAEYARRLTIARATDAVRVCIPAPFALESIGGTPAWTPAEEFVPLRTLVHFLNSGRPAGVLRIGEGVLVLFAGSDEDTPGFGVAWGRHGSVAVEAYLGPQVRQLDLWGSVRTIPQTDGLARIELGRMPVILEGVDVPLAMLQSSFSLSPNYVESHERHTQPMLRFTNHFDTRVDGVLTVRGPSDWSLTPRTVEFGLAPGESLQRALDLVIPPRQPAVTQPLDVTVELRAPRAAMLRFAPELTIGLRDIIVELHTSWDGDTLVIDQSLRNASPAPVSFGAFCDAPRRARQESQFLEVPPGETRVRRYTFPEARAMRGQRIRAGVHEIRGDRGLEQLVDVPE
ncbi:MAG: hypothetical protein IPM64_11415 [Phycisphaerales bacterium]|nr:hypothetical protein [Phycisphaerales bacterium]